MEIDGQIAELIKAGVRAGKYWAAIRQDGNLTAGFTKLAQKHRAVSAALMDELAADAGLKAQASVAMPRHRG